MNKDREENVMNMRDEGTWQALTGTSNVRPHRRQVSGEGTSIMTTKETLKRLLALELAHKKANDKVGPDHYDSRTWDQLMIATMNARFDLIADAKELKVVKEERDRLLTMCELAIETIEELAGQQAMNDEWYEVPLGKIVAAVADSTRREEGANDGQP